MIMAIPYDHRSGKSSVFWAIPDDQGNSDDHEFQCDRAVPYDQGDSV